MYIHIVFLHVKMKTISELQVIVITYLPVPHGINCHCDNIRPEGVVSMQRQYITCVHEEVCYNCFIARK